MPPAEFRKLCREFAARYVEQHKKDFKRLGIFGRWNDPYLTMSFDYEATIAGAFLDFMEKGYVYRGRKPVYWCFYDSTALAEAEVEYEDHVSPSIWVKFAVVGGGAARPRKLGSDVSAVIWTTTPWTIPHNRALAFHPDFDYAVVDTEKGALLLAADRVAALAGGVRHQGSARPRDVQGTRLRRHEVPASVFADSGAGRACRPTSRSIKAAASFTPLPATAWTTSTPGRNTAWRSAAPLDDRGVYLEGLPEYKGKDVFTANPIIVKLLADRGALLGHHEYKHSYPHCWRCHNPVIFRATEQWFIGMDQAAHGAKRIAAQGSTARNSRREVDPRVGRRPHVRNDRGAAGLVRFAPAFLGRADHRFLLRRLRDAAGRLHRAPQRREVV